MQPQTSVKFPFVKDNFSVLRISDGESRIGPTGLCKIYSRFENFTLFSCEVERKWAKHSYPLSEKNDFLQSDFPS